VPVELVAGKEYDFAFETSNAVLGAFRAQMFWKTPEIFAREAKPAEPRQKTRTVYLPAGNQWIDFWTGEVLAGGKSVVADAPIDKIPLMVRSGSIIPMGPFVQYSTERPADPLSYGSIPERTAASRCMRTKTITITTKKASIRRLISTGMTRSTSSGSMPGREVSRAC